jgi:hypothetical protein
VSVSVSVCSLDTEWEWLPSDTRKWTFVRNRNAELAFFARAEETEGLESQRKLWNWNHIASNHSHFPDLPRSHQLVKWRPANSHLAFGPPQSVIIRTGLSRLTFLGLQHRIPLSNQEFSVTKRTLVSDYPSSGNESECLWLVLNHKPHWRH